MTQTKRTPGLYVACEQPDRMNPRERQRPAIISQEGREVAVITLTGYKINEERSPQDWAQIFAAAPETAAERDSLQILAGDRLIEIQKLKEINTELLGALKKANALVKAAFEHHTGVWKAADDVIDISDAAIAKATGQSS